MFFSQTCCHVCLRNQLSLVRGRTPSARCCSAACFACLYGWHAGLASRDAGGGREEDGGRSFRWEERLGEGENYKSPDLAKCQQTTKQEHRNTMMDDTIRSESMLNTDNFSL